MLYVSNKERSTVPEISVADKIIENEIRTGAEPEGIAVASDGKTLVTAHVLSEAGWTIRRHAVRACWSSA